MLRPLLDGRFAGHDIANMDSVDAHQHSESYGVVFLKAFNPAFDAFAASILKTHTNVANHMRESDITICGEAVKVENRDRHSYSGRAKPPASRPCPRAF